MDPVARVPAGDARKKEKNRDGSAGGNWTPLRQPILKIFHGFASRTEVPVSAVRDANWLQGAPPFSSHAIDEQNNNSAHNGTYEPRTFARSIPS
jgi:hypothetical protein